jgi:hypothetical protein
MDKILKDTLIIEGIQQCETVLKKDKKMLKTYPNGEYFFKGCINGFTSGKNNICLEQFESSLMHLRKVEEELRAKIRTQEKLKPLSVSKIRKDYADVLGRRCSLEFLYKNLSLSYNPE